MKQPSAPNGLSLDELLLFLEPVLCGDEKVLFRTCVGIITAEPQSRRAAVAAAIIRERKLCRPLDFQEWALASGFLSKNPNRIARFGLLIWQLRKREATVLLPGDPKHPGGKSWICMPLPHLPKNEAQARPFAQAAVDTEIQASAWCAPTRDIGLEMISAERAKARSGGQRLKRPSPRIDSQKSPTLPCSPLERFGQNALCVSLLLISTTSVFCSAQPAGAFWGAFTLGITLLLVCSALLAYPKQFTEVPFLRSS